LSDVIRARNKREDRLLNVRMKFYEREKNIQLTIIRKEQHQLERVRSSLYEQQFTQSHLVERPKSTSKRSNSMTVEYILVKPRFHRCQTAR